MFSRPKILFLVSLLFVALLNPKFNPYLLFKFLIFIILVLSWLVVSLIIVNISVVCICYVYHFSVLLIETCYSYRIAYGLLLV